MKAILAALALAAAMGLPAGAAAQDDDGDGEAIVQNYEPDPAVWLVHDDDTRIYLFGTVHALPEGFRWRSARFDAIVAEADELILETSDDDVAAEDPRIMGMMRTFAKRPPLSERLSPGNGAKWLAIAASSGVDPEAFDRMPLLLAMIGMGMSVGQRETGADHQFGVETVLEAEFAAAGKPVGSIESAAEVLLSLLSLDDKVLVKELDRALSDWNGKSTSTLFAGPAKSGGGTASSALAQEHAWAQGGEVDIRDAIAGGSSFNQSMAKQLLDRRNRAWAGWLEQRLAEPGTVLVAVGAGHLGGRISVQALLAERGVVAERLN
jgi:uncharacterized protein YbaP (TraB family)